jgi:hypothetical protein
MEVLYHPMRAYRFVEGTMSRCLTAALICLGLVSTTAQAQNLAPAPAVPDVVMECFRDNQPGSNCGFACGGLLAQAPHGLEDVFSNVTRVEFYYKQTTGRTDTRTWVFVQAYTRAFEEASGRPHKPPPQPAPTSKPNVYALYIGPTEYCGATVYQFDTSKPVPLEMRITKFQFD